MPSIFIIFLLGFVFAVVTATGDHVCIGQELDMFLDRHVSALAVSDDDSIHFEEWIDVFTIKSCRNTFEDRAPVRMLPHYFGFIASSDKIEFDRWASEQIRLSKEFLPQLESRIGRMSESMENAPASRLLTCLGHVAVQDNIPNLIRTAAVLLCTASSTSELEECSVFLYLLLHENKDLLNQDILSDLNEYLSDIASIRPYANMAEVNAILRRGHVFSDDGKLDPTVVDSFSRFRTDEFTIPFLLQTGREDRLFTPSPRFQSNIEGHLRPIHTNEFEVLEDLRANHLSTLPREIRSRFFEKTLTGIRLFCENVPPEKKRIVYTNIQRDAELALSRALRCDSIHDVFTARLIYKSVVRTCDVEADQGLAAKEWLEIDRLLENFPHRDEYRFGRRTLNFDSLLRDVNAIAQKWESRLQQVR